MHPVTRPHVDWEKRSCARLPHRHHDRRLAQALVRRDQFCLQSQCGRNDDAVGRIAGHRLVEAPGKLRDSGSHRLELQLGQRAQVGEPLVERRVDLQTAAARSINVRQSACYANCPATHPEDHAHWKL